MAQAPRETGARAVVDVRVVPRAGRTGFAGERDGRLLIRLAAPPVEGAANDALLAFLATALDLPRRNLRIVAGEHSRNKRIAIEGLTLEQVRAIALA
jgi:uncharacterized protein